LNSWRGRASAPTAAVVLVILGGYAGRGLFTELHAVP
jgi:hypothetical protein